MAETVLRVRMISGERIDVICEEPEAGEAEAVEYAIATLARDSGVLRTRHGGRLVVLFGRGVAAVEVSPPGPVL
jgi:hypothetical protein